MCLSEAAKRQMRTCTQPRLSLSLMQTLKDGYMHTRWVSVQLSLNMLLLYKDKEEVYLPYMHNLQNKALDLLHMFSYKS